ncbi:hypothetical protein BGW80DRAFT_1458329 [Lactifluus volemus]|nr:hypothetical protein BGW80DRAFT_1458329 [Lactifluus volemus]
MSSPQPEVYSNPSGLSYVDMLLGFGNVPQWHNFLSSLFIWMITTGFITIPPALISYSTGNSNKQTSSKVKDTLVQFVLNEPLFAIGVSIFFVGLIGMLLLTRVPYMFLKKTYALKDNHFWLLHKYYLRVAEGGVYGLISLFVSIFVSGNNQMDPQTIAVLTITCFITALFGLLTAWSYFKTRQARKAHEKPRPQASN